MYIAGINNTIDTGDSYFLEISKTKASGAVNAKTKIERGRIAKLPVYNGTSLEARIEHSRWIVDCPNCNGAEFAFEDKLFFCSQCQNSDIGGKARRVKMPDTRKQIETLLISRPIKNRHWYPAEPIDKLINENIKAGLEVI